MNNVYAIQLKKSGEIKRSYYFVSDFFTANEIIEKERSEDKKEKMILIECPLYNNSDESISNFAKKQLGLLKDMLPKAFLYGSDKYKEKVQAENVKLNYWKKISGGDSPRKINRIFGVEVRDSNNQIVRDYELAEDYFTAYEIAKKTDLQGGQYKVILTEYPVFTKADECIRETASQELGIGFDKKMMSTQYVLGTKYFDEKYELEKAREEHEQRPDVKIRKCAEKLDKQLKECFGESATADMELTGYDKYLIKTGRVKNPLIKK